jgi:hypothetical protein
MLGRGDGKQNPSTASGGQSAFSHRLAGVTAKRGKVENTGAFQGRKFYKTPVIANREREVPENFSDASRR